LHTGEGSHDPGAVEERVVDQQGAVGDWLRQLAIRAGIYAGVFFGGAILAFVYSYVPLHNAKNWKIGYLEERLATKDAQIESLTQQIRDLEGNLSDVPDGETFKVLQDELVTADKTVNQLEQQVARLEKRAKEAERERDTWKSRHAEAEKARAAARAAAAPPPAAPAAASDVVASGVTVEVGTRWRSSDGKSDFDLVAIQGGKARIVPDASQLRPGVVPKTLDVGVGERFTLDGPDGAMRTARVVEISGESSIRIDVSE
jgi:hypothetical protein